MDLRRRAFAGCLVALVLIGAAFAVPSLTGWFVGNAGDRGVDFPPLDAFVELRVGWGSIFAVALGILVVVFGSRVSASLRWPLLLALCFAASFSWLVALAALDGPDGFTILGDESEYLPAAHEVTDIAGMLSGFIDRIPLDAEHNWPVHVAGHPPGALLFFVFLTRFGLGGDLAAGLAVCALAATIPLAVMVTLRRLADEALARTVVPFLVITPSAIWLAVSADAVFAACAAWAVAAIACASTTDRRGRMAAYAAAAGLLFGACAMLSYGLGLVGLIALAIAIIARRWAPLMISVVVILAVVACFALAGFALWEAFPALQDRYWAGIASERPAAYWLWGNLAALAIITGPAVWMGLACMRRSSERAVLWLVAAAVAAVAVADLSLMSKGETERIWLPFVPWLTVATAATAPRHRRTALLATAVFTLLAAHLLKTKW